MTYPATNITTRTPGEFVDDSEWNELVAALNFLANRPSCRLYHNANQSVSDSTVTELAFNSELWDTDGMHDTVTNNTRITFKTAGLYVVSGNGIFASGTDYFRIVGFIRLNGATEIARGANAPNSSGTGSFEVHTQYKFAVGDYVELQCFQDNSANAARDISASNNTSPAFTATWIGRG